MLSGTLTRDSLVSVFRALSLKQRQGILEVTIPNSYYELCFHDGVVVDHDIMTPLSDDNTLRSTDGFPAAMRKLAASGFGRLPVVDYGRLVGMVTRGDIMRNLEIRSDLTQ